MSASGSGTGRRTRSTTRNIAPRTTLKRKREEEKQDSAKKMMASPGGTTPDTFEEMERTITLAQFSGLLDTALDTRLATNREEIAADFKHTMDEVRGRLDKNEHDITALKRDTHKQFDKINKQLATISASAGNDPTTIRAEVSKQVERMAVKEIAEKRKNNYSEQEVRSYWWSRKCLIVAPIPGDGRDEMWHNLHEFFRKKMKVPSTELQSSDIVDIRRRRQGRRSPALEVLVVFQDAETRDRVQAHAKNLAIFVENGKPTATVRPDVPMHLGGVHKTLLQYGHALKSRYGQQFRRNIRFEDAEHTFVIDVCLRTGGDWITIGYERALADRKQNCSAKEKIHGDLLSSNAGVEDAEEDKEAEAGLPGATSPPWNGRE